MGSGCGTRGSFSVDSQFVLYSKSCHKCKICSLQIKTSHHSGNLLLLISMITLSCTWDFPPSSPLPPSELSREKFAGEITLSMNYFYTRNEGSHLPLYVYCENFASGKQFSSGSKICFPLLTLQGGLSESVLGVQFEYLSANVCLRLCLEMAPSAKTTAPKGSSWCFRSTCHQLERPSGTIPVNVYPSSHFLLLLI